MDIYFEAAAGLPACVVLECCPDSVWYMLPGGPVALNEEAGQAWQYMCTIPQESGLVHHEFRHRAHPLYKDARVYAYVEDGEGGPRLMRLMADGVEQTLPGIPSAAVLSSSPTEGRP